MQRPLQLNDALRSEEAYGQYFKEEVRKQLVERFGWERVYQGGLQGLHDARPRHAEGGRGRGGAGARGDREAAARRRRGGSADEAEPLQAALVALDPRTGEVRAHGRRPRLRARATSIARPGASASRARRSSRSSTPPRSSAASRPPPSSTS